MPVERAIAMLTDELARARAEVSRLEKALDVLKGTAPTRKPSRPKPAGGVKRSGKRPAAGQRREQLLEYLKASPGAKPAAIADGLSISPSGTSHLLRKAREDKLVRKVRGGGYGLTKSAKERVA